MPSNTTAVPVTNNWLDTNHVTVSPSSAVSGGLSWYPANNWSWGGTLYTEPRKIRLKLSEIERLREAAREDLALKAVLQKFTGHIEIEVDFA